MANNRPRTPTDILNLFKTENDPLVIHHFLAELKEENYAKSKHIDLAKPADVICHALTTRRIKDVSLSKVEAALISPTDIIQIIQLVIQAVQMLISYIESTNLCKKKSAAAAHEKFLKQLSALDGNNPYINLSKVGIDNLDLSNKNLRFVDLSHAKLTNLNLSGANLQYTNLNSVSLKNVNLNGADLTGADLRWLDLSLTGAQINSPVSLKSFLQTNYPKNVQLEKIPTAKELEAALNDIRVEFEGEKHMGLLTNNILKIASIVTDPREGNELMNVALTHSIYTDHLVAKVIKAVDNVVTKTHNKLFHDNDLHTIGTLNQMKLINKQKEFVNQLRVFNTNTV